MAVIIHKFKLGLMVVVNVNLEKHMNMIKLQVQLIGIDVLLIQTLEQNIKIVQHGKLMEMKKNVKYVKKVMY